MVDDFNKKPPLNDQAAITQKKRIPVYILILVGIFLLAVLFYMFSDVNPDPNEGPATQPNATVPANNTATVGEATDATATEATATVGEATDATATEATATDGNQTNR